MVPKNFKLIYSQSQIAERVAVLGKEISAWADAIQKQYGEEILAVPVLGGGVFFFADLVRAVDYSLEMAPVKAWAYAANVEQLSEVKVDMRNVPAKGRSVLLIDDICDSGKTLATLKEIFEGAGAREVKSAALVRRILPKPTFKPEWVGFEYTGAEWFVGYGMDDQGKWRNLPSVHIIT